MTCHGLAILVLVVASTCKALPINMVESIITQDVITISPPASNETATNSTGFEVLGNGTRVKRWGGCGGGRCGGGCGCGGGCNCGGGCCGGCRPCCCCPCGPCGAPYCVNLNIRPCCPMPCCCCGGCGGGGCCGCCNCCGGCGGGYGGCCGNGCGCSGGCGCGNWGRRKRVALQRLSHKLMEKLAEPILADHSIASESISTTPESTTNEKLTTLAKIDSYGRY